MKKLMYCLFICVKKITQTPNKGLYMVIKFYNNSDCERAFTCIHLAFKNRQQCCSFVLHSFQHILKEM